jgi:hypothetical protein
MNTPYVDDLKRARDYAAALTQAGHRPDCLQRISPNEFLHPDPTCLGCATDDERAMWQRITDDITEYLGDGERGLWPDSDAAPRKRRE